LYQDHAKKAERQSMQYTREEQRWMPASHRWAALVCMSVLAGIVILAAAQVANAGDWRMRGRDAEHSGTADEMVEPPLEVMGKYETGGGVSNLTFMFQLSND